MKLTLAQFDYVLYYLPFYIAKEAFLGKGPEIEIICTGNDDSAVEAVCRGEADIALSDPSMAAIASEEGKPCRVVGQIAHRAPVFLITLNQLFEPLPPERLAQAISGMRVSTYPRPSTTYACTVSFLRRIGLEPGRDVEIVETPYRDELGPLFCAEADFAMVNEPIFTQALGNGAKRIHSLVGDFGPMTFSGFSVRRGFGRKGEEHRALRLFLEAVERGCRAVHSGRGLSLEVACRYFPEIEKDVLEKAIGRLVEQDIITRELKIPEKEWDGLIKLRLESGELKSKKYADILD